MIEAVYIERKDGDWINDTAFTMAQGCYLKGIEVRPFRGPEIEHLPLTKETLVHGYVGTVRKALRRLDVPEPHIDGAPPEDLLPLYGRRMWPTTMTEVRRRLDSADPIFIKPLHHQKAFTGHVTSGQIRDLIQTAGFDDEFEILASEVVEFDVEYRLFVNRRLFIGCRHYAGDFSQFIDFDVAFQALRAWRDQPVSYSLDLGVATAPDGTKRTLIVEVNDAFALGGYGLPSIPYAEMVIDRWEEMVGILRNRDRVRLVRLEVRLVLCTYGRVCGEVAVLRIRCLSRLGIVERSGLEPFSSVEDNDLVVSNRMFLVEPHRDAGLTKRRELGSWIALIAAI